MYDKRKEEEKKQLWVISKCLNTLFARSSNVVANYKIFVFFFLSILSQSSFPWSLNIIKKVIVECQIAEVSDVRLENEATIMLYNYV